MFKAIARSARDVSGLPIRDGVLGMLQCALEIFGTIVRLAQPIGNREAVLNVESSRCGADFAFDQSQSLGQQADALLAILAARSPWRRLDQREAELAPEVGTLNFTPGVGECNERAGHGSAACLGRLQRCER